MFDIIYRFESFAFYNVEARVGRLALSSHALASLRVGRADQMQSSFLTNSNLLKKE